MFESRGASLKKARELKREKALHHLRIRPSATAENKSWAVTHHSSDDSEPTEKHNFTDADAMLEHVTDAVGVPNQEGGE